MPRVREGARLCCLPSVSVLIDRGAYHRCECCVTTLTLAEAPRGSVSPQASCSLSIRRSAIGLHPQYRGDRSHLQNVSLCAFSYSAHPMLPSRRLATAQSSRLPLQVIAAYRLLRLRRDAG